MTSACYIAKGTQNGELGPEFGSKAANSARMAQAGFPVPPGIALSSSMEGSTVDEIIDAISPLLLRFEDYAHPFPRFLAVKPSPRRDIGILPVALYVPMDEERLENLIRFSGDLFAYDIYLKFLETFAQTCFGYSAGAIGKLRPASGVHGLQEHKEYSQALIRRIESDGYSIPGSPLEQLAMAVQGIYASAYRPEVIEASRSLGIKDLEMACYLQQMVLITADDNSGAGILHTRDPMEGGRQLNVEWLRRDLKALEFFKGMQVAGAESWGTLQDEARSYLTEMAEVGEKLYGSPLEMQWTMERGKVFFIQARPLAMSPAATITNTLDLIREGMDAAQVMSQVEGSRMHFSSTRLSTDDLILLTQGLPVSGNAAYGRAYFQANDALRYPDALLVLGTTAAGDIKGILSSVGFITPTGGATTHAAIIAREHGLAAIVAAKDLRIGDRCATVGNYVVKEGDTLAIDGNGNLYHVPPGTNVSLHKDLSYPDAFDGFSRILDGVSQRLGAMTVMANADTLEEAIKAVQSGAGGIGLCRSEHMFFDPERLYHLRCALFSKDEGKKRESLQQIMDMQYQDCYAMLREMGGKKVVVRLLDPPSHEFLPLYSDLASDPALAGSLGLLADGNLISESEYNMLHEANPMMGVRGCRLAIERPEIYRAQVDGLLLALSRLSEEGIDADLTIEVPMVASGQELEYVISMIRGGNPVKYHTAAMIETPAACLEAGKIAQLVDEINFGTNDLTQFVLGMSRDDTTHLVDQYQRLGLSGINPFISIASPVKELLHTAVTRARQANPAIRIGLCGEQGADRDTIYFLSEVGLNTVSVTPSNVVPARLYAMQAAYKTGRIHLL